jgi:hypothetical protein
MRTNFNFTGEGLARELLLHLTHEERIEEYKKSKGRPRYHAHGWLADMWRRIMLGKRRLYLVKLRYGDHTSGNIIIADSPRDACVQLVPFFSDYSHHCRNPYYDSTCEDCRKAWNEMAERMNTADVTWLGWAQPGWNWVIHI